MDSQAHKPPLVAHIIYSLGTGGLENGLVNIINRCPPDRYRHAIICLTQADNFADRIAAAGVDTVELRKQPGHDIFMYWRLWRELHRLRPAIVHTRNLAALETQVLGLIMPGVKRVHGEHGRDMNDLDGSNPKYLWLRRLLRHVIHRFITVSRDLERWLIDSVGIPAQQVEHIYNGVDQSRFAAHRVTAAERRWPTGAPDAFLADEGCTVMGTVGRLATVKDQQLIIRALRLLVDRQAVENCLLRCILVGDGPERANLQKLIADFGLERYVWLAGDRDDIPALLAAMDIFLLPSLGEGISNTILEAMATGLPVIASDIGGNPELVQEGVTGKLIPVGDALALADAIESLSTDTALRERMGRAAIQRVQRDFDWTRTVTAYLKVYDELLGPVVSHSQPRGA